MTGRRCFHLSVLAAALLAALAFFAFSPAGFAERAAFGQAHGGSAQHHCPEGGCADDPASGDLSCCVGAACGGAWLAPQPPMAAPAALVSIVLSIPSSRLALGVGARPDPRPPRFFV